MSSNTAELQNFHHHPINPNANSKTLHNNPESYNANSRFSSHTSENSNANSPKSHTFHQNSCVKLQNLHAYDDIINTPYPFLPSTKNNKKPRERIPLDVRAAEFAPFAALTGYNEAVDEVSDVADDPNKLTLELFRDEELQ